MSEDQRLLREYAINGSRQALEELIQRHLPLVYSSALRQVRDSHLAEDVTQAVFIVLTTKARTIRNGVALGGWLLAVTRCASVNAMKKQAIQRKYELLAAKPESSAAAADQWEHIAPLLDGELNRLADIDRDAVVLRFFQDRSFAEIGVELGLTEEAARKRVTRALERLRGRLGAEKQSLTAGALSMAIGSYAVLAVPRHVTAGMIAAGVGSPAPHCLLIAKGALKMLAWTKAKIIAAVAASLVVGTTSVVLVAQSTSTQPAQGTLTVGPQEAQAPPPTGRVTMNKSGGGVLQFNATFGTSPSPAQGPSTRPSAPMPPGMNSAMNGTTGQITVGGGGIVGFGTVMPGGGAGSVAAPANTDGSQTGTAGVVVGPATPGN